MIIENQDSARSDERPCEKRVPVDVRRRMTAVDVCEIKAASLESELRKNFLGFAFDFLQTIPEFGRVGIETCLDEIQDVERVAAQGAEQLIEGSARWYSRTSRSSPRTSAPQPQGSHPVDPATLFRLHLPGISASFDGRTA